MQESDLEFLPVGRRSLRLRAQLVPVDDMTSPEMKELYAEVLAFAEGRTAPRPGMRPLRLVGVSANQVGIDYAFVYVNVTVSGEWTDRLRLLVNPRIVGVWGEDEPIEWWHGCFSTGDLITIQSLPRYMEVEYFDERGERCRWVIDGKLDGARQLHNVWHEIKHTEGRRHVDVAIENNRPIYVIYVNERRDFNAKFLDGERTWLRIVPPEAWSEMLHSRAWRHLIVHGAHV